MKNTKKEAKFCFAHSNRDMKRKNCNNINFDTFQSFPVILERKPGNLKIVKRNLDHDGNKEDEEDKQYCSRLILLKQ